MRELCARFWNSMIRIHGQIISQSWPLLTPFYSGPIVHWVTGVRGFNFLCLLTTMLYTFSPHHWKFWGFQHQVEFWLCAFNLKTACKRHKDHHSRKLIKENFKIMLHERGPSYQMLKDTRVKARQRSCLGSNILLMSSRSYQSATDFIFNQISIIILYFMYIVFSLLLLSIYSMYKCYHPIYILQLCDLNLSGHSLHSY